jgi:hypothetical protein
MHSSLARVGISITRERDPLCNHFDVSYVCFSSMVFWLTILGLIEHLQQFACLGLLFSICSIFFSNGNACMTLQAHEGTPSVF